MFAANVQKKTISPRYHIKESRRDSRYLLAGYLIVLTTDGHKHLYSLLEYPYHKYILATLCAPVAYYLLCDWWVERPVNSNSEAKILRHKMKIIKSAFVICLSE